MLTVIINRRLVLLVLVSLFFTVLGVPVNNDCKITLDDIDSTSERFLYTRNSDDEKQRCTYCSAITRTSSNAFIKAKEDQCVKKNINIDLVYNLVPNCKNMDPITCVIPNPIENGEWICSCSGIGHVKSGEVLVYTNCTQQCKPGYELVGDSFGHCGERVPHDTNFPTEFRYGNAKCSKREIADPHNKETVAIIVLTICVAVILVVVNLVLICICMHCQWCCFKKDHSDQGIGADMETSPLQDNGESSVTGTRVTQTTGLTSPDRGASKQDKETNSLLPGKEDAEGLTIDLKSQDWKYTPEISTEVEKLRRCDFSGKSSRYPESPSMDPKLLSGEPISGLSTFPEISSVEDKILNKDVNSCDVHLHNLTLDGRFWNVPCVLDEKVNNLKPQCCNMAVDILECVYPEFDKQKVEWELNDLCNKNNPLMAVLFELLKNYPCNIGHVVQWCVEKGYPSVVQYLRNDVGNSMSGSASL
ncbi:hypothetical protein KP79_PYT13004 [Mizuhopecten yessoensis]|uniref:Uncharacterized protein n=1 Tax=Mizuhopecten yessoensis TaxID=6573 RepID=A0A210QC02_MIZYE|nr:hypothetical protein KP79_PYT13004 [Mizuhopecten yessoensis]